MRKILLLIFLLISTLIIETTNVSAFTCTPKNAGYYTANAIDTGNTKVYFDQQGILHVQIIIKGTNPECFKQMLKKITVSMDVTNAVTGATFTLYYDFDNSYLQANIRHDPTNPSNTLIDLKIEYVYFKNEYIPGAVPLKRALVKTLSFVDSPIKVTITTIEGKEYKSNVRFKSEWITQARESIREAQATIINYDGHKYIRVRIPVIDERQRNEIAGVVVYYTEQRGNVVVPHQEQSSMNYKDVPYNGQYYLEFMVRVPDDTSKIEHVYVIYGTTGVFDIMSKTPKDKLIQFANNNPVWGLVILVIGFFFLRTVFKRKKSEEDIE